MVLAGALVNAALVAKPLDITILTPHYRHKYHTHHHNQRQVEQHAHPHRVTSFVSIVSHLNLYLQLPIAK